MHEVSIAESVLDTVKQQLGGVRELVSATLTVGALSGVDPEALQFCFTEVASERGFGRPRLVINRLPARLHCNGCGEDYETFDVMLGCPRCTSLERRILSGRQCAVDSVEVEDN